MSSVNRHIVVAVLVCISLQINSVLACYGLFFLNRKAIAATACEKKTRNCCGSCFLQKKVAAANDVKPEEPHQQPPPKSPDELLNMVLGIEPHSRYIYKVSDSGINLIDYPDYHLRTGSLPRIFHPPKS
ncbi:MAG: hypothetical protein HGA97_07560 [Chlorobiaceae bacterium]|nr:hypothetical protein [Chlorobiaceae bacterium]